MHHIYKTKAIVLSSNGFKESDKQINLLTAEFGLLKAVAQGVRKMESKLRPSLQDFSITEVALVSGRVGWRLTNANLILSIADKIQNKNLLKSLARIFNLIERLVVGESDDDLFNLCMKFIDFIVHNQNKILHIEQINNLESIFVLNILSKLGYVDNQKLEKVLDQDIDMGLLDSIDNLNRKEINRIINQAIRESGL